MWDSADVQQGKNQIGRKMFKLKSIVATASACVWLAASAPQAQEITLRSLDESFSMSGTLVDFDGETYQLATAIGQLSLSVNAVVCEGEDCPSLIIDVDEFTIAGSSTIGSQLMPALIEAYAFNLGGDLETEILSETQIKYTVLDANGDMYSTITLNLGTSSDAFVALASGEAYVGLSSRRVNQGERDRLLSAGKGDFTSSAQEWILGLDGLAISLNEANPVQSLSLDQISDIFAGNIRNWREVGGLDLPVSIYRQANNAGATEVFESLVMAPTRRSLSNIAFILDDSAAIEDAVESDRNGIGIVSISNNPDANIVALRSVCGQISSPTDFSIKTEEYPLSRRLFAYVKGGQLPEKVAELLWFITSNTAQDVVVRSGFANQNVTSISLDNQGRRLAHALLSERDQTSLERLQQLVAGIQDAAHISLTFRFNPGSVELNNKAELDVIRLAEMVQRGDFDGKVILIIGFADSSGAINENQRLSQARADLVRDQLVEAIGAGYTGSAELTSLGYGNLFPIGCNETDIGKDTNRRVEIWVR